MFSPLELIFQTQASLALILITSLDLSCRKYHPQIEVVRKTTEYVNLAISVSINSDIICY